jgi:hypothetical protein
MVTGTLTGMAVWRGWGIWLALVACCFTGWAVTDYVSRRNQLRLETLAEIMANEAASHYRDMPTLTRIR